MLSDLAFEEVSIRQKDNSEAIIRGWNVAEGAEKVVFSAYIEAIKPPVQE